ncbi:MAG: hypothetical protein P1V97_26370 [Planctomycetota bacterium]|nr:hypothetical protein [Planctomycetota bacterium]
MGSDSEDIEKTATIEEIRAAGHEPQIELLAHGLADEKTAFRVEAAAIDLFGITSLTNRVRGKNSLQHGRVPLGDLLAFYERRRIDITEPSALIRINRLYHPRLTVMELYDATRGIWKLGKKREQAECAFAIFEGIVREVYEISGWFPAGSTLNSRNLTGFNSDARWEFVGRLTPDELRERYRNGDVSHLFPSGAQNPIKYLNAD